MGPAGARNYRLNASPGGVMREIRYPARSRQGKIASP